MLSSFNIVIHWNKLEFIELGDDAKDSPPADGESDNSVVLAVVISITLVELGQMVAIILFHFIIYNNRTTEGLLYTVHFYRTYIEIKHLCF